MTDSHAHLDACDEEAEALVERAAAAGVSRILTVGTGIESCKSALALADAYEGVHAVLGIHPHDASTPERDRLDELQELLSHPKAVAVGETGLDTVRGLASLDDQRRLLDANLALAAELQLPVVIHNREADAQVVAALEEFAGPVILHCFSSPALLPVAIDRGYFLSFAGNATYPKAGALREAAALVPRERILVETDSPYLSPQPRRGKPNEPANVVHTVRALADVRGESADGFAALTHANAAAAFSLP